jgi:hypothetical protein
MPLVIEKTWGVEVLDTDSAAGVGDHDVVVAATCGKTEQIGEKSFRIEDCAWQFPGAERTFSHLYYLLTVDPDPFTITQVLPIEATFGENRVIQADFFRWSSDYFTGHYRLTQGNKLIRKSFWQVPVVPGRLNNDPRNEPRAGILNLIPSDGPRFVDLDVFLSSVESLDRIIFPGPEVPILEHWGIGARFMLLPADFARYSLIGLRNSGPEYPRNHSIADLELLANYLRFGSIDCSTARCDRLDVDQNGTVDAADYRHYANEVLSLIPGDANFDRKFNSSDLLVVFRAGQYEDGHSKNSFWNTGDWTGDQEFDTSDLIAALQTGRYESNAVVASVPEPKSFFLLVSAVLATANRLRRKRLNLPGLGQPEAGDP